MSQERVVIATLVETLTTLRQVIALASNQTAGVLPTTSEMLRVCCVMIDDIASVWDGTSPHPDNALSPGGTTL